MAWLAAGATLRGDRPTNQDQVLLLDDAIAVLDGATSWLPPASNAHDRDGGWYARHLGSELALRLPGHGRAVRDILAEAIGALRDTAALAPGHSPYSTATIARWNATSFDVLVLGDSPALVIGTRDEVTLVCDERLAATAAAERAAYSEHLRAGHGFGNGFDELIASVQRAERHSFNTPDGFWVAEADPDAPRHAVTASFDAERVRGMALLSDGAAAGILDYRLTDWAGMWARLRASGPSDWLASVHDAELTDPDGKRWPRTKRHDDKSIALIERREP